MARFQVLAEVAGVVREILARPGDALQADDAVVLVECMKMEIPIASPAAGTVLEVLVAPGERVGEGQAVALLEA